MQALGSEYLRSCFILFFTQLTIMHSGTTLIGWDCKGAVGYYEDKCSQHDVRCFYSTNVLDNKNWYEYYLRMKNWEIELVWFTIVWIWANIISLKKLLNEYCYLKIIVSCFRLLQLKNLVQITLQFTIGAFCSFKTSCFSLKHNYDGKSYMKNTHFLM